MKEKKSTHPFANSKSWKVLGLTKQDIIKYFFGGNAALAVIIILCIVIFLVYNATSFFPNYKKSLTLYRLSGQELVDFSAKQYNAVKELESLSARTRSYEIQHQLGALYRVVSVHAEFKSKALKKALSERKAVKRAETAIKSLSYKSDVTPEQKQQANEILVQAQLELKNKVTEIVNNLNYSDLTNKTWATSDEYLDDIRSSVVENITTGTRTEFIKSIEAEEAEKISTIDALPHIQNLKLTKDTFAKPLPNFKKHIDQLREIAVTNKGQGEKFSKSAASIEAQEQAKRLAKTEEQKEKAQIGIDRLSTTPPDFTTLCEPLYASVETHKPYHADIKKAVTEAFTTLPDESKFDSEISRGYIEEMRDKERDIQAFLDSKRTLIENWKHDKEYGMARTVAGFFFGTEWITNSSWQDFYGVLPLLSGSVFVAIVAICIAVPFSVGGAIYVNRLSTKAEQTFIKPFIEFIQAIPSIVLAFFGYVVLGAIIQKYSQSWLINWLPGFPVEDRYTILNAGLLLALMAVPTIFTLCEDALNNVPKSYKEASLALGATKLQTVTKVILPSCASGVIAAVLLGFGRIVGETMVVLLVLGGRISIPTSWTQPAHSMTGILAQEIGEVDEGSLHWGALFMVGLVLFSIALGINYISQRILKKYTQ